MDSLFNYICQHAAEAHYIFFGLLLLAGLNIPISEDLLLLTGGALISRCMPDQYLHLYIWMFIGCWLSGAEAYWIGRLFGPKLYHLRWFRVLIRPRRIKQLRYYYEKFGVLTFIVGRFIPGGVRNALFITAGMGKMPFPLFLIRDFFGALLSTSVIFYLGFIGGENYEHLVYLFKRYNLIFISVIIFILISFGVWFKYIRKNKQPDL